MDVELDHLTGLVEHQRMADEPKRVWVLGAGFSRSLGGPLLKDLLSLQMRGELQARYPECPEIYDSSEARAVYGFYHYGCGLKEGRLPWWPASMEAERGQPIWRDAEHFLDYLDTARISKVAQARLDALRRIVGIGIETNVADFEALARAGKRILAAECCAFMRTFDPDLEQCQPYLAWARRLTSADTIITFNYDTLIETAAESQGRGV